MLLSVFVIAILCVSASSYYATAKRLSLPLSRLQSQCPDCDLFADGAPPIDQSFPQTPEADESNESQVLLRARRIPPAHVWPPFPISHSPEEVSAERMMNSLAMEDLASSKRNGGTNLSILNPVEVLRQRMKIDALKERQQQIEKNAKFLDGLGKRQINSWRRGWR